MGSSIIDSKSMIEFDPWELPKNQFCFSLGPFVLSISMKIVEIEPSIACKSTLNDLSSIPYLELYLKDSPFI